MALPDQISTVFQFMKDSTWIQRLDVFGYPVYSTDIIPTLIMTLDESSWAEELLHYRKDFEDKNIPFYSVPEMKKIYLLSIRV